MSDTKPRLLDFHSHWGTQQGWRGSQYETPEARKAMRSYFKWDMSFVSEDEQAEQFRRFLLSARGQAIFARYGFSAPGKPH